MLTELIWERIKINVGLVDKNIIPQREKNCKNAQKEEQATASAALSSSIDERDSFPEHTMSKN